MTSEYKKFAVQLRRHRKDAKMTISDVAKALGVANQTVVNFENAAHAVLLHHAIKIARMFQIDLMKLSDFRVDTRSFRKAKVDARKKKLRERFEAKLKDIK